VLQRLDELFEAPGQRRLFLGRQGRGETDVVQQAVIIIKAEQ
jgi:hypothetical protein